MKKRTKNMILKSITCIALIINTLCFTLTVSGVYLKILYVPWALSIAFLILFIFSNIDNNWLPKVTRGKRTSLDNSKYYFNEINKEK